MEIKTKYNRNDIVYYLVDRKILQGKIDKITINAEDNGLLKIPTIHIKYDVIFSDSSLQRDFIEKNIDEQFLFSNTTELFNGLECVEFKNYGLIK